MTATVVPERVGPPVTDIDGIDQLQTRMADCETVYDWSFLLNDYLQWGNNTKVASSVAIFNLGAAHDCPNRFTDRCQVGGDECYAVVDERRYDYVMSYMRRQEYLWDCLDAETFADAFLTIVERKYTEATGLKILQAGAELAECGYLTTHRFAPRFHCSSSARIASTMVATRSTNRTWSSTSTVTSARSSKTSGSDSHGTRSTTRSRTTAGSSVSSGCCSRTAAVTGATRSRRSGSVRPVRYCSCRRWFCDILSPGRGTQNLSTHSTGQDQSVRSR
jgi:hypothetical protein